MCCDYASLSGFPVLSLCHFYTSPTDRNQIPCGGLYRLYYVNHDSIINFKFQISPFPSLFVFFCFNCAQFCLNSSPFFNYKKAFTSSEKIILRILSLPHSITSVSFFLFFLMECFTEIQCVMETSHLKPFFVLQRVDCSLCQLSHLQSYHYKIYPPFVVLWLPVS